MLDSITLRRSVWLAALALVIHELEEWNIAAWFETRFRNSTGISPHAIWLGLVVVSTVVLLWAWLATRFRSDAVCAAVALPFVVGVGAGNALEHLAWLFAFGAYDPGVVTATLLVLPAAVLFVLRIPRRIPVLVECGLIIAVVVAGAVSTYRAGPVLQHHQIALQQQFIHLARDLGV